jgi:DNA-binding CsgD family transcriptional regulator/tetratricopeptide (TPR) repeat protein
MLGSLDVDVLASTFDCDRSEINNALGSGIKAGIVSARNEIVTFRHALVRESVRLSFPSVEAEELHKRLASAIESVHVDDLSVAARSLAHHWYMGHDKERARRWALAAGEFALALNALADARGAFELAIACSPLSNSPDALKGIAEVEIREDRLNEAHALLQRAVVGFKEANQHNHVASVLARLAWVRTILHSPGAVEALDEALQMVPRENRDLQRATLLAQKGQMFIHSLDRISEGETILAEAATQAAENKVYSVKAECLDGLAWAAEYNYRPAEADRRSAEARSAAILSGKPETIGRTHNNSAILLIIHGHHLEALEILDTARESLRKSFGFGGVKVVDFTEATARWRMGDPGRVDALIARQEASWPHFRGYRWILQSWSAAHLDDRQRALHTVAACWRDVGVTDIEASVDELSTEAAEALICDLLVKLESGDRDSLALAERLLEFYQSGTADEVLLAKALAARAAIISGDVVSSLRFVDEIEDELRRYSSPYFDGMAKEARGYLALEAGKADVAFDSFMAAAMTFEGCSNLVDRARSLRRAGMALSTSHEREAVKLMRTALEIATECGSTLEVRRTESALRSLGVRPRAGRPRKKAQASEGLSAREEEVAVLVAAGATNAEIASRLFLSERTVQDHITHALRKLGASGRAGLAAWAAKAGLF